MPRTKRTSIIKWEARKRKKIRSYRCKDCNYPQSKPVETKGGLRCVGCGSSSLTPYKRLVGEQ